MVALARGQPRAPAGSPASVSELLKRRDTLRFPHGSLSLSVAQFHQLICVGIRMGENTPALPKAGLAPQKSKIKANGTFLYLPTPSDSDVAAPGGCYYAVRWKEKLRVALAFPWPSRGLEDGQPRRQAGRQHCRLCPIRLRRRGQGWPSLTGCRNFAPLPTPDKSLLFACSGFDAIIASPEPALERKRKKRTGGKKKRGRRAARCPSRQPRRILPTPAWGQANSFLTGSGSLPQLWTSLELGLSNQERFGPWGGFESQKSCKCCWFGWGGRANPPLSVSSALGPASPLWAQSSTPQL